MKDGWSTVTVGEVCDIQRGTSITKKQTTPGDVPVVAGGIEPTYYHNLANRPAGVITVSGSGANAGFVNYWDSPIFASDCFTLVPRNREALSARFTFFALKAQQAFIWNELKQGAAQPHVYPKDVAKLRIAITSLPEQHRIVETIENASRALERAQECTKTALNRASDIFDQYLRQVFHKPGEGWVSRRLSDIATTFARGRSRHRPRNDPALYDGPYPFIQTGEVRNADRWISDYSQTYNEAGLAQSKLWPAGTVCVTIAANIAESAILDFEACFPDSIIGIVVDDALASNRFLHYMLQYYKSELKAEGKGSAQDNINLGTFETRQFPFPSRALQEEIITVLDGLFDQVNSLRIVYRRKLTGLEELRQSLLHHAVTGQI
jgi:type I restriction enzyme, S subunit